MSAWLKYKDQSAVIPIEILRKTLNDLDVPWFVTERAQQCILSVGDIEMEISWVDND